MDKSRQTLSAEPIKWPSARHGRVRWQPEENTKFREIIKIHMKENRKPTKDDWEKYTKLFPGRTTNALSSRYNLLYNDELRDTSNGLGKIFGETNNDAKGRKTVYRKFIRWSASEDDALRTAVDIYGAKRWGLISSFVGTRTRIQCYNRWLNLSAPSFGKRIPPSYWMRDKQKQRKRNKIIGILSRNGLAAQSGSSVIGALLDHQQEKEQVLEENNGYRAFLRKRVLDGRSLVVPFSPEEDHALLRLVKSYGSRWAMFAKILTDRFHTQINADDNHTAGQKSVVVMQKRTPSVVYTRYFQLLRDYSGTSRTAFSDLQATSDSTTEDNRDLVDQPLRCYRRREKRRFSKRRTWSKEEQAELTKVVEEMLGEEHGFISWNYVAEKMKKYNRNSAQCQYYWTQICGTHLRHTPFAVSEDRVLWLFIIGSRSRSHSIASQPVPTIASLMTGYLEDSNLLSAAGSESSSLDSRALTCRSSPQILNRIKRFKKVLQWLREEAKVEASEELFDLVRGLTNSPSAFKIRSDNLK